MQVYVPVDDGGDIAMAVQLRPYQPGDEVAILELFAASFERPMSRAYWSWRFRDNPLGGPWIELAWDGDRLAAHYAVSPAELVIGGARKKTALSMTTMTHPDYRGQDLFGRLADQLYGRLAAAGFAAVWGFPNRFSHRLFLRRLDWRDVGEVTTLVLDLAASRARAPEGYRLARSDHVPAGLDRLGCHEGTDAIRLSRREPLVAWRLFAAPAQSYRCYSLHRGGEDRGFLAVKPYGADALDIVDLLVEDAAALEAGLALLAAEAQQAGIRRLNCWMSLFHPWRGEMERFGFAPDAPVTMLAARWFEDCCSDPYDLRSWRLPMIASDVF